MSKARSFLLALHRDERGFLAALGPILAGAAKVVLPSLISGVAGYTINQLTGGQTTPASVPSSLVPMTSAEQSRRLVARTNVFRVTTDGMPFRSRRMNVLNPRALSRAIRRAKGFTKYAQRVGSFTQPGKKFRLKVRRKR